MAVGPDLEFASLWGPTLYTNTFAILPMASIGLLTSEHAKLEVSHEPAAYALLVLSCVVGVAISYLGWRARSMVSATCYTVLGVANKMMTVLANVLLWDKHATPAGLVSLLGCLLGAACYQQAPMRRLAADLRRTAAMTTDTKSSARLSPIDREDRREVGREARSQLWNVLRVLLVGTALGVSCIWYAVSHRPHTIRSDGAMSTAARASRGIPSTERGPDGGMAPVTMRASNISVLEQLPVGQETGGARHRGHHRQRGQPAVLRGTAATSMQPGSPDHPSNQTRVSPVSGQPDARANAAATLPVSAECKPLLEGNSGGPFSRSREPMSAAGSCGGSSARPLISGQLLLLLRGRFVVRNASVIPATRSGSTSRAAAVVLCKRSLKRTLNIDRQVCDRAARSCVAHLGMGVG